MRAWLGALGIWLVCPIVGWAACTGSSPNWTSSIDRASVAQCVTNAQAGDTINVAAGTATWSPSINVNKSVALIGAGIGNSVITGIAEIVDPTVSGTTGTRISGFTFQEGAVV